MKTQLSVEGSRNHHLQMLIIFKQTSNKHPTSYPISTTFTPYRFPLRFPLRFFGGRGSEEGRCLTTNKAISSNIKGESTWHMGQKNSSRVHRCRGRTNHHFPYCGWQPEIRSTHQLRLGEYPIIYKALGTFQVVVWDF